MSEARKNWQRLLNNDLKWKTFKKRAELMQAVRSFFIHRGYLEIDPPIASPWPSLDSNIDSVKVKIHDMNGNPSELFLHTSPEHAMKKLLAAGSGDIFFLGKVFRDSEITDLHNPEFTMAEWYKNGASYNEIMDETEDLIIYCAERVTGSLNISYQGESIDLSSPWGRISVKELFDDKAGIDIDKCMSLNSIREAAAKTSVFFKDDDDWDTIFFRIFMEKIEPELGFKRPCFVTDYPAKNPLMAKLKDSDPNYVERAELFIAGIELANGYTELTDGNELLKRFRKEQELRPDNLPIDTDLIKALNTGMPECSGIALGIDRLLMLLLDKKSINDVILFPTKEMM